jgi:lipoprotein-anchoring transpeptidase ErfK/SrfK
MNRSLSPLLPLVAALILSACAPQTDRAATADPSVASQYAAVADNGYVIPEVNPGYLNDHNRRSTVAYAGSEAPGTIIVDPYARFLYYTLPDGQAIRYGIAVGRAGRGFSGSATVNRKEQWPSWRPTANMVRTEPEVYGPVAGGLPGGLDNPLGARALYLYRGGRDTMYRIHGTNNASTIGRATSAGCIRLFNQDALDLFERAPLGTPVKVRSPGESVLAEGEMVEIENGYLVPAGSDEAQAFYERQQKASAAAANISG